jgi:hypothetical protein
VFFFLALSVCVCVCVRVSPCADDDCVRVCVSLWVDDDFVCVCVFLCMCYAGEEDGGEEAIAVTQGVQNSQGQKQRVHDQRA